MSENFYGSICITDILAKAQERHSAFTKGNNGKVYCNISVWLNDSPDKYGNLMSLMLSSKKDNREQEGKTYIGNCKKSEYAGAHPISDSDASNLQESFSGSSNGSLIDGLKSHTPPTDDLPF